jgi:hypothetical protein
MVCSKFVVSCIDVPVNSSVRRRVPCDVRHMRQVLAADPGQSRDSHAATAGFSVQDWRARGRRCRLFPASWDSCPSRTKAACETRFHSGSWYVRSRKSAQPVLPRGSHPAQGSRRPQQGGKSRHPSSGAFRRPGSAFQSWHPARAMVQKMRAAHHRTPDCRLRYMGRLGVDLVRCRDVGSAKGDADVARQLAGRLRRVGVFGGAKGGCDGPHVDIRRDPPYTTGRPRRTIWVRVIPAFRNGGCSRGCSLVMNPQALAAPAVVKKVVCKSRWASSSALADPR